MAERFSAFLRRRGERIWRAIESHPFLRELHAGTLPMDRFTYFILQDYVYLLDFAQDRKSTRLNSSHSQISYAVFCLKKKKKTTHSLFISSSIRLLAHFSVDLY